MAPSMFSRRRASSQPPRPSAPPSASAAIAASSAFLHSSTSSASLSSAAAAAALRSHTTSPEPIGNIQTKRMIRRGSQSSVGNSSAATGRGGAGRGLVRRDSSSSMTERSFRSPSPGRNGSARAVSPAPDAPPIPAIPKNLAASNSRRSASLEPPMRITSPSPRSGQRHASVDRPAAGAGRNRRTSDLPKLQELERENSNRSINFSRPMSPPASPLPRPASAAGWFTSPQVGTGSPRTTPGTRPKSSAGVASQEASRIQQNIQSAANSPVTKKKKQTTQGNSLANGTMQAGPQGTAVGQAQSQPQPQSQPASAIASIPTSPRATTPLANKKKSAVAATAVTSVVDEPPPRNPARVSPGRDGAISPTSPRIGGTLHKQPSVVREDPEAEVAAERGSSTMSMRNFRNTINTSEGPARLYVAPTAPKPRSASLDIPRSAHFSEGSIAEPFGSTRHNPPPRSVSPMKSALRHSPSSSVRGTSPGAALAANVPRAPQSDTSDNTSLASQDGHHVGKRKKSVRVSFDDGSTTTSPPTASTPNGVKAIRRDLSPAARMDDEDELMQPRSALPSFSSVRERRAQDEPEVAEKAAETLPSSTSARPEASSDFAIAAVIANHHARKTLTEPVPPEVTSVETSGYASDSSTYSDTAAEPNAPLTGGAAIPSQTAASSHPDSSSRVLSAPLASGPTVDDGPTASPLLPDVSETTVPEINLQPATPGLEEQQKAPLDMAVAESKPRYSMPGAWDEPDEPKSELAPSSNIEPADVESSDDDMALEAPVNYGERHSPLLEAIYESESDDSADFSDAPEEPEEFASLDAIVASPVPSASGLSTSTPPDSPSSRMPAPKQPVFVPSPLSTSAPITPGATATSGSGDWTEATKYWSSLSKQKKDLLEREAADEEEEASVIQEPQPKKKQSKPVEPVEAPIVASPRSIMSAPRSTQQQSQPRPVKSAPKPAPQQSQPRPSAMKKSVRAEPGPAPASNETHMRTSMRSGASGGAMRSSMREGRSSADGREPRGALQKKHIPASPSGSLSAASAVAAAQYQPAKKPAKPAMPPADDSDSESSFKKKRRASVSTVDSHGRYNMKRSMRGASVDVTADRRPISPTPGAQKGSGRFSVRSLSPNGSFMGRNRGENLRQSLRGGSIDDTPTMRGRNSKAAARDSKSPTRFSMSGFSRGKPPSAPTPAPAPAAAPARKLRFNSRFAADSDDEGDTGISPRMGFRSRFNDSDDEDMPNAPTQRAPTGLAPVRGIPRRRDQDEDSSDLDDSDDEPARTRGTKTARVSNPPLVPSQADIDRAMEIARRNVAAMNGGREPGVPEEKPGPTTAKQVNIDPQPYTNGASTTVPETPTKRRGLLGSVLGRRRTSSSVAVPQVAAPSSPASRPQSPGARSPKLQRRNTPQFNRANSNMSTAIPQPPHTFDEMAATQQKVTSPGAMSQSSQHWPLPPPPRVTADGVNGGVRPSTSDGTEAVHMKKSMRPDMAQRSQSGFDLGGKSKPPTISNGNGAVYSERTGKKKKFGGLRKLFGLHD
ncbi:hypothetical protein MBLNU459_g2245t3 [Dothideomycetes sp. NU459]